MGQYPNLRDGTLEKCSMNYDVWKIAQSVHYYQCIEFLKTVR